MSSAGAQTDRIGPVFFFDQPTRHSRAKGSRSYILNGEPLKAATKTNQMKDCERLKFYKLNRSDESREDNKPDDSRVTDAPNEREPMDAYKRAAPQLLDELARLLSQHEWTEKGCIPHGIVNILNEPWCELTGGASLRFKSQTLTDQQLRIKVSQRTEHTPPLQASVSEETGDWSPCVWGNAETSEKKSNPQVKKLKQNSTRARSSTAATFSISTSGCKDPGGIIQLEKPCYDEPQSIRVCHWVVERLRVARNPQNLQSSERDLSKPLILRHYGDTNDKLNKKRGRIKPEILVNGFPLMSELKLHVTVNHKLHYRINDGSSFIYYPSGGVAVCQSHSGLSCGGFYTNVFSDGEHPVTLATITAFGHGAVTDLLSSAITAVWDEDGGFLYDEYGNVTKEWCWPASRSLRNRTVVQVSDQISVTLFSGTSATLSFKCDNESVYLPLSSVRYKSQEKEMVGLQMLREGEGKVEPSAQRRKYGPADRELKRLQQRVRNTVEDWLDYYRNKIGIRCPPCTDRMPVAPLRTGLIRDEQKGALPSLKTPEHALTEPGESRRREELQKVHRLLSEPAERPPDLLAQRPRTSKKRSEQLLLPVTRTQPLRIYGNINPESVFFSVSPESETPPVSYRPANTPPFAPCIPLTVCPALLRAALQGEAPRRSCCCSSTLMPVVTDLEYDALIMGQPPHSQQIIVVCVTLPQQPNHIQTEPMWEELYRRTNKHRTTPCSQCQMDSFRLLRYEMLMGSTSFGSENVLLQRRHNAAPGVVLMYIRGKLLFVGGISTDDSWALQRQISKTRRNYRLGVSLPSDYKTSETVKNAAATGRTNMSETAQETKNIKSTVI